MNKKIKCDIYKQWDVIQHYKEVHLAKRNNIDDPEGHYTKWNKPGTKKTYYMTALTGGI